MVGTATEVTTPVLMTVSKLAVMDTTSTMMLEVLNVTMVTPVVVMDAQTPV